MAWALPFINKFFIFLYSLGTEISLIDQSTVIPTDDSFVYSTLNGWKIHIFPTFDGTQPNIIHIVFIDNENKIYYAIDGTSYISNQPPLTFRGICIEERDENTS